MRTTRQDTPSPPHRRPITSQRPPSWSSRETLQSRRPTTAGRAARSARAPRARTRRRWQGGESPGPRAVQPKRVSPLRRPRLQGERRSPASPGSGTTPPGSRLRWAGAWGRRAWRCSRGGRRSDTRWTWVRARLARRRSAGARRTRARAYHCSARGERASGGR